MLVKRALEQNNRHVFRRQSGAKPLPKPMMAYGANKPQSVFDFSAHRRSEADNFIVGPATQKYVAFWSVAFIYAMLGWMDYNC